MYPVKSVNDVPGLYLSDAQRTGANRPNRPPPSTDANTMSPVGGCEFLGSTGWVRFSGWLGGRSSTVDWKGHGDYRLWLPRKAAMWSMALISFATDKSGEISLVGQIELAVKRPIPALSSSLWSER